MQFQKYSTLIQQLLPLQLELPSILKAYTSHSTSSLITEELSYRKRVVSTKHSVCLDFVSGDLLDYEIKPLELGPPKYEERLKSECGSCEPCNSCYTEPAEQNIPPAEASEG